MNLDTFANHQMQKAKAANQLRILHSTQRDDGIYVTRGGRKLISFSCNDYLGLSHNTKIKQAAITALEKYGAGGGASRLVTGNSPLYAQLESSLAKIKSTDAALVFGSGYLANIGIIPALAGKGDLIIADKLIHASMIDGCKLSGAKLLRFSHNNAASCQKILKAHRSNYKNCLIVTEHVFSMDGDIAPINTLADLAEEYDAWLMSDDAHGLGILTPASNKKPHIQMGTLSKAAGSYGGYVCASNAVIEYLTGAARALIYSTSLPPGTLAASICALEIILADKNLCAKPLHNAQIFTSLMQLPPATSPIVPLIIGDEAQTISAAKMLEDNGFLVTAIRPPTVPKGTSRLRFTFSALHKAEDIAKLAQIIKKSGLT